MRFRAKPVDERQRDRRPGRYTVSGSFVELPEGELPDETRTEGKVAEERGRE